MNWTLWLTALGVAAAVLVPVAVVVWQRRQQREDALEGHRAQVDVEVRRFMANLSARYVLRDPVFVENPEEARNSLEGIREAAAKLLGTLDGEEDKDAVVGIREVSREAARAMARGHGQNWAPRRYGNYFEDILNHYRDTVRFLVVGICDRHEIAASERPRITSYHGGFPDEGEESFYLLGPE